MVTDGGDPPNLSLQKTAQGGHKRQRISSSSANSPSPKAVITPLPYQDLAIPISPTAQQHEQDHQIGPANNSTSYMNDSKNTTQREHEPLHPKLHLKHAMCIHCVECRKCTLLAPAGMCWSSKFDCLSRSKTFPSPARSATVTTKDSQSVCDMGRRRAGTNRLQRDNLPAARLLSRLFGTPSIPWVPGELEWYIIVLDANPGVPHMPGYPPFAIIGRAMALKIY